MIGRCGIKTTFKGKSANKANGVIDHLSTRCDIY